MESDDKLQVRLVLLDALERYWRLDVAEDEEGRRGFDEVAAWFASTDGTDPRAFESLCRRLALDPQGIRAALVRSKEGHR